MAGTGPPAWKDCRGAVACSWRLRLQLGLCHPGAGPTRHTSEEPACSAPSPRMPRLLPEPRPLGAAVNTFPCLAGGCSWWLRPSFWDLSGKCHTLQSRAAAGRALRLGATFRQVQGGGPSPLQWHPFPKHRQGWGQCEYKGHLSPPPPQAKAASPVGAGEWAGGRLGVRRGEPAVW